MLKKTGRAAHLSVAILHFLANLLAQPLLIRSPVMEHVEIQTTQNVGIAVEVAGLGDRIIAALIDYLLLFAYVIAMLLLIRVHDSMSLFYVSLLPYLAYFLLCEIFLNGQSVGKRIRNIKVARLDGRQPTVGNYILRWLLRPVDIDLVLGSIGLATVWLGRTGQRLGDLAAGTTVIRIQPRVRLQDTAFSALAADYHPTFPEAEALSDADVTLAKEVYQALMIQGRTPVSYRLGERTKDGLTNKLGLTSDLPPYDFLRTLIADYNHFHGRLG